MDRSTFLTSGINRLKAGIEIGPFYSPIAPKAAGWKTMVVDFTDQDGLLKIAHNHTAQTIRDRASNIEVVDVVWQGQPLDEACRLPDEERFHYLIASHVIEHIPDVISFFRQIKNLASEDFVLSMAVPDCRREFDFFKPLSTTADALLAYREKRTVHSPETMFVSRAYGVWVDRAAAWLPGQTGSLYLPDTLDSAHAQYVEYLRKFSTGTQIYEDAHCWYWTPSSFELMILELNYLGHIDFLVDTLEPQASSEFLVRLRTKSCALDAEAFQTRRLQLLMRMRCELAEPAALTLVQCEDAGSTLEQNNLRNENALFRAKQGEQEIALSDARTQLKTAQKTITDLKESSSWRITKPLRATKNFLRYLSRNTIR